MHLSVVKKVDPRAVAWANFVALAKDPYRGRIIVIGRSADGKFVYIVYIRQGRSDESRNGQLVKEGKLLFNKPLIPGATVDPMTVYKVMDEIPGSAGLHVVTNGSHTDEIMYMTQKHGIGHGLEVAMKSAEYEPDRLSTPRIAGACILANGSATFKFAVARRSAGSEECDHIGYEKNIQPGFGLLLSTYLTDGFPPPHWEGEPILVPMRGDLDAVLDAYWAATDNPNGVSIAAKRIKLANGATDLEVFNKYALPA